MQEILVELKHSMNLEYAGDLKVIEEGWDAVAF